MICFSLKLTKPGNPGLVGNTTICLLFTYLKGYDNPRVNQPLLLAVAMA